MTWSFMYTGASTHCPQNIKLRLASLPPPKGSLTWDLVISSAPHAPTLVVPQLTAVRTSINSCLDAIDVATWGGDATNAQFVSGQLQLLHDHIIEAQAALKGHSPVQPSWWDNPVDENVRCVSAQTESFADCNRHLILHCLQMYPSTCLSSTLPSSSKSAPWSPIMRGIAAHSLGSASATPLHQPSAAPEPLHTTKPTVPSHTRTAKSVSRRRSVLKAKIQP